MILGLHTSINLPCFGLHLLNLFLNLKPLSLMHVILLLKIGIHLFKLFFIKVINVFLAHNVWRSHNISQLINLEILKFKDQPSLFEMLCVCSLFSF
jgi:hypothetical protein